MSYQFTSEQLVRVMGWAIDSFVEHIDKHGKDEETAQACAIREVINGMAAERELIADGVKLDPSHVVVTDPRIYAALAHIERRLLELRPTLLAPMPTDPAGQLSFARAIGEQRALTGVACILMGLGNGESA